MTRQHPYDSLRRRSRSWRWSVPLVAALLVALGACGGDDSGRLTQRVDTDVRDAGVGAVDAAARDTSRDVAQDTSPRGFQEPCEDNGQCGSGWCVPTSRGTVCTGSCDDGCPPGWDCGLIVNRSTDYVTVCLDRAVSLCQPCEEDADCNRFTPGAQNRCLSHGDEGRFCGVACSFGANQCPLGYACTELPGVPFSEGGQCVPEEGAPCGCNPLAQALSLATTCAVSNDLGRCEGARSCGPYGLTDCDAPTPSEEICNGADDDCDGQVDEDLPTDVVCQLSNAHGTCPGVERCVGGRVECLGVEAQPEICDGLDQDCDGDTDEGYPDLDGDELADCVDDDDDGDGTPDDRDCAPKDPAISKTQPEVCGDGVDNDCDGATDEADAEGCAPYWRDVDGDGFGAKDEPARCLCAPDPQADYVVDNADDCDDLDGQAFPHASEVCNGADDDCDGDTDEGVQAPCGGCVNLCIVDTGPGTTREFSLTGANAQGVQRDSAGRLVLAPGVNNGVYHEIIEGWPLTNTRWTVFFVQADTPGDGATSLTLRYRAAADQAALASAPWQAALGPFPPQNFPALIDLSGHLLEVQIGLGTSDLAMTPVVQSLSVLAESVP